MAKTATYSLINSTTLGSAQSSVTFSSIPSTFTDLVLVCNGGVTIAAANAHLRFNSDTGSNYSDTNITGTGSAASSGRSTSQTSCILNSYGYPENDMNWNCIVHIMDYSNTTTYKTLLSRSNQADNGVSALVGLWRSTAAITTIDVISIFSGSPQFSIGTTFKLYGIEAGNL